MLTNGGDTNRMAINGQHPECIEGRAIVGNRPCTPTLMHRWPSKGHVQRPQAHG
jgi:hypothetical protein